jgi:hypothetical protein
MPAAGVRVEYTRGAYPGHASNGQIASTRTSDGAVTRLTAFDGTLLTDTNGAFELIGLEADQWTCCALLSPQASVVTTVDLDGAELAPLELRLPEVREVRGRLLVPDGVDRARLSLQVRIDGQSPAQKLFMLGRDGPPILPPDDRFDLVVARQGDVWLNVRWIDFDTSGPELRSRSIVSQRVTVGVEPLQLEIELAPFLPTDRERDR